MLPYSDRNKQANSKAENSTLNPETNSLSPSAKSKGARLVSAKHEVNHIKNIGNKRKKYLNDLSKKDIKL